MTLIFGIGWLTTTMVISTLLVLNLYGEWVQFKSFLMVLNIHSFSITSSDTGVIKVKSVNTDTYRGGIGVFRNRTTEEKIFQNHKTAKRIAQNHNPHTKPSKNNVMVTQGGTYRHQWLILSKYLWMPWTCLKPSHVLAFTDISLPFSLNILTFFFEFSRCLLPPPKKH